MTLNIKAKPYNPCLDTPEAGRSCTYGEFKVPPFYLGCRNQKAAFAMCSQKKENEKLAG